ncbi:MAG: hypothetical protein ABMA15_08985 [Vicinamibacterales bacterium]
MSLLLATPSAGGQARNADTRAWYQAYQDGVRQVQQRNWQAAISSLLAAKRSGPAPGRRVPFYGDVFDDYLPDYYLGIAYMNTLQYKEAAAAFDAVQQTGLITAKDREYPELNRQTTSAASALEKQAAAAAPPPSASTGPVQTTTAPTQGANLAGTQVASADPNSNLNPPNKADTPAASSVQLSPATAVAGSTAVAPTPRPPTTLAKRTPVQAPPAQNTRAASATALASESTGMAAFFAGDYQRASNILSALTVNGGTPRAEFYLACSRAALVLTGGAEPATLSEARTRFSAVNATQFLADQRYISPRILQTLRATQ